jgi:hypothetical protein
MALEKKLKASEKAIVAAIKEHKAPRARAAAFGVGGALVALKALREFCKNWPDIEKQLNKMIEALEQSNKPLAVVLKGIKGFLGVIAKVCPLIP